MLELASWQDAEVLRIAVLGWRAGPVPGDEDREANHLVQRNDQRDVVAAVSFMPHPCPQWPGTPAVYLWGMAVLVAMQGRGVGTRLLDRVLDESRKRGVRIVWADARETAVSLYVKRGAVVQGGAFADELTGLADRRVIFTLG